MSWGNFGHGATSVKKSLRNHFGRINNVYITGPKHSKTKIDEPLYTRG